MILNQSQFSTHPQGTLTLSGDLVVITRLGALFTSSEQTLLNTTQWTGNPTTFISLNANRITPESCSLGTGSWLWCCHSFTLSMLQCASILRQTSLDFKVSITWIQLTKTWRILLPVIPWERSLTKPKGDFVTGFSGCNYFGRMFWNGLLSINTQLEKS